jgi:hypothetical protein
MNLRKRASGGDILINLRTVLFCVAALAPLAMPALADDPYMTESGLPPAICNQVTNSWCGNVGTYDGTTVYLLSRDANNGIQTSADGITFQTGDLIIQAGVGSYAGVTYDTYSNVIAVVAFEDVTVDSLSSTIPGDTLGTTVSTSYMGPEAFIYSYNGGGGAAGLPNPSALSNVASTRLGPGLATGTAIYYPCGSSSTSNCSSASTAAGAGDYKVAGANLVNPPLTYALVITTPEPYALLLTLVMLGVVWLGMVGLRLRRRLIG